MWLTPADALRHWGAYFPDLSALEVGSRVFTYRELISRAIFECRRLKAQSESARLKRCVVVAERKADFLVSAFGAMLAGKSVVCVNPTLQPDELCEIFKRAGAHLVLGGSQSHPNVRLACERVKIPSYFEVDTDSAFGRVTISEIVSDDFATGHSLDAEWGVFFSSGSTGDAKPIVQSHLGVISESLAWCLELELKRGDRFLVARPFYYTGGLALTLACLTAGATVLAFDGDENDTNVTVNRTELQAMRGEIDWLFMVPEQVRAILSEKRTWRTPGKPKSILVMGSKISGRTKLTARDFFGAKVIESWGNSEGLGTITKPEDLDTRANSIGRPFVGERILVVDENAIPVPNGTLGLLAGSEDTMFSEYANLPSETQEARRSGLVISSDLGRIDQDGYVYIVGRKEDVILLPGGEILACSEIEEDIRSNCDYVDNVVCLRMASGAPEVGILVAQHSVRGELQETLDAIQARVLEKNPLIATVLVIAIVKIPRLASGKTDRIAVHAILGWREETNSRE